MSTYKRRIIYVSDIEWSALQERAHERRTTISALVRQAVREPDGSAGREVDQRPTAQRAARPATTARTAQARRDEILHKVSRGSV